MDVLIIDDGSNDETPNVLAELAKQDERVRVVRRKNAGVSAARNTGLDSLQPETAFVTFLDSDAAQQPTNRGAGQWIVTATLLVKTPTIRRRIELELNGPDRNLCHVQALHLHKREGFQLIKFSTQLTLADTDFPVSQNSLPSKYIEQHPGAPERLKYDKIPFTVLSFDIERKAN